MKIGIDCRMFNASFTGIGRYTHELVKQFIKINRKEKHEIVLFFNNPAYRKFKTPNKFIKKILVNAPHYSLKEQTTFLKILLKEKCDIVHFPHFNIPILYRKPYIVTIHDLTLTLFPGKKRTKWYHRMAYNFTIKNATRKAKKIIAVSKNTKIDLIHFLKIPSKKIIVIENGVNPNFTLLKSPKCKIKDQFLLYTGVWRSHKNIPRLLAAFNILRNEKNLDLKLAITGKPDPCYPEVKQIVQKLGLKKHVIFTGLVSEKELIHLYNAAYIYVFPSLYEGFGFPPLESMRCGTPVAASNISSIPEVCGKENAVYFDPYDIADIAEKIYMLHKDADLQAKLIADGMKHATKFSWEKTAQKTYETIKSCLNPSKN